MLGLEPSICWRGKNDTKSTTCVRPWILGSSPRMTTGVTMESHARRRLVLMAWFESGAPPDIGSDVLEIQSCRIGDNRPRSDGDYDVSGDRPEIGAEMNRRLPNEDGT